MEKHKATSHRKKYSRTNNQCALCRRINCGSDIKVHDYVKSESIGNDAKDLVVRKQIPKHLPGNLTVIRGSSFSLVELPTFLTSPVELVGLHQICTPHQPGDPHQLGGLHHSIFRASSASSLTISGMTLTGRLEPTKLTTKEMPLCYKDPSIQ